MIAPSQPATSAAWHDTRYQPLVLFLLAICGGIVLDRHAVIPLEWWLVTAGIGWLAWFVAWLPRRTSAAACLLLVSAACTAGAWHHVYWRLFTPDDLGVFAAEEPGPVCVEVEVLSGPRWSPAPAPSPLRTIPKGDESRLFVSAVGIRDGESWRPASGRANLTVDGHLLDVRAGDRLQVFASLSAPAPPQNPGEFDFAEFQRTQRVLSQLFAENPDCVSLVARGAWWNGRRCLDQLRSGCNALLWRHVSHRRAGLASAVLLGAREQLDRETTEDFFVTGTVHLLAISGMNVGILVYGFWWCTRVGLLSRRATLVAASVFVIVYALVTDAQPPVMRATILVLVICAARWMGRRALAFNSLAAGGLVVLAFNPAQLFQVGTQLSFLAVAALSCCERWLTPHASTDPLDRLIERSRPWIERVARKLFGSVGRLALTGAVIWLVVLPLVWQRFCLISPAAVPLGPFLALPIAVALYAGFAVLVVGWAVPPLGDACGRLCDLSFASIEWFIQIAKLTPANHVWLPAPAWWWTFCCYAALGIAAAFPERLPPRRWCAAIVLAWGVLGLATSSRIAEHVTGQDDRFVCTFVSVGHGTSALLELPGGQTLLYDAGRMGSPLAGTRAVAATLWSRRIRHLDAVVISHADADHYNALPDLLKQFSVGVVYVSPMMFDNEASAGLRELRRSTEAAGVPIRELSAGNRLQLASDARIEVLHPPTKEWAGSDNSKSIVLEINYAGRRLLLPGDLEPPGLTDVLAEPPLDCDVVMAPHHGSDHSNPSGFAAWSTPEYVVISGSHGRENKSVEAAFLSRGAEVFHTAHGGAVRVEVDRGGGISVRSWRKSPW